MADQNNKSSIAKTFSGLPLKALIGAPLKAAADANGMMARSQVQFLLSTCFNQIEGKNDVLAPLMVTFQLERQTVDQSGKSGEPSTMDFSVPLMTLIPISSLAVEKMSISFEMEVKSSTEQNSESSADSKRSAESKLDSQYRGQQFSSELHGCIANKSSNKNSASASYKIELQAGSLPLPKGVTALIDAFTKGIPAITKK